MTILKMYVTMFPVIMAGILNMLFVKTGLYSRIKRPIDGGKTLRDGKRLFGENKTWAGFFGMIITGALSQLVWGFVCLQMPEMCSLYSRFENAPLFNLSAGAAMGFAYVLFELPNSFIKRRLDIPSGKTVRGIKGCVFFFCRSGGLAFRCCGGFCRAVPHVARAVFFLYPAWRGNAYCGKFASVRGKNTQKSVR